MFTTEQELKNRFGADMRSIWTVGEHTVVVERGLGYGEKAERVWVCTCGFQVRDFDNRAKKAVAAHKREVK